MKKRLAFLLTAMMVIPLAGCAGTSSSSTSAASSQAASTQNAGGADTQETSAAESSLSTRPEGTEEADADLQAANQEVSAAATEASAQDASESDTAITDTSGAASSQAAEADQTDSASSDSSTDGFVEDPDFAVPDGYDQAVDGRSYYTIERITYHSDAIDADKKANVLLPADYTEDKQYPVLYLMHGGGGDENEWIAGSPGTIVGNLVAEGQAAEMIIVLPRVQDIQFEDGSNQGIADDESKEPYKQTDTFLKDLRDSLMPYIESHYSVKTDRENTAIAGMSMGGRESLYIGFSMPDKIGNICSLTPAPGVKDGEWYIDPDFFQLPEEYKDNTTIMIVKGSTDEVVGDYPLQYDAILTENGIPHYFFETEGGHTFPVWKKGLYNFAKRIFQQDIIN